MKTKQAEKILGKIEPLKNRFDKLDEALEINWETIIDNASPQNQGKYYCALNLPLAPEPIYIDNESTESELEQATKEVVSVLQKVGFKCFDKGLICLECKDNSADIVFTSNDDIPPPGHYWECLLTNPNNSKIEWKVKIGTLRGLTREVFEEAKTFWEECRAKKGKNGKKN